MTVPASEAGEISEDCPSAWTLGRVVVSWTLPGGVYSIRVHVIGRLAGGGTYPASVFNSDVSQHHVMVSGLVSVLWIVSLTATPPTGETNALFTLFTAGSVLEASKKSRLVSRLQYIHVVPRRLLGRDAVKYEPHYSR